MRTALIICTLLLAACGADGPPTIPPAKDAVVDTPAIEIETPTDRTGIDADLSRPIDPATTTEEF